MLFANPFKARMPLKAEALPGRDAIWDGAPHCVLGTPTMGPFPDQYEEIHLGLGCFWGAERLFWKLDGVHTTAVGYGGGFTPNPTYEEVCSGRTGHTELVLVVYDPKRLRFAGSCRLSLKSMIRHRVSGREMISERNIGRRFSRPPMPSSGSCATSRRVTRAPLRQKDLGRSPRRLRPPGLSFTPRIITSNISTRCRTAIAASGVQVSPAPVKRLP